MKTTKLSWTEIFSQRPHNALRGFGNDLLQTDHEHFLLVESEKDLWPGKELLSFATATEQEKAYNYFINQGDTCEAFQAYEERMPEMEI